MATAILHSESAPATNVVRLPSAAPRKVRQHWNKRTRALRAELSRFPEKRALWPEQRRACESAKLIREMERTPELAIATAIYRAMSEMDRLKVKAFVAMISLKDGVTAVRALEWLKVIDGDGTRAVHRALERLDSGEWE